MRRTTLGSLTLAGTAVLAAAVPAFASSPSAVPVESLPPTSAPSSPDVTVSEPAEEPNEATPSVSQVPTEGQVSVVPSGAADTGVSTADSASSGSGGALVGGGAAAAALAGGATVLVVRRRGANGA